MSELEKKNRRILALYILNQINKKNMFLFLSLFLFKSIQAKNLLLKIEFIVDEILTEQIPIKDVKAHAHNKYYL